MERELLIRKWLDNDLDANELEAFKKLEDYEALVKLSDSVKHFKADEYNSKKELNIVLQTIKSKKSTKNNWLKPLMRIAAVLVISFGVYYFTANRNTTVSTLVAEKNEVELPDMSQVKLNNKSSLTFNKKSWNSEREVELEGEAYFRVAKGSKFSVITQDGVVTVLGTQFNVKQRDNYFEVICFEGSVGVEYKEKSVILKPGYSFLIIDGNLYAKDLDHRVEPSWINNESYFNSLPYKTVISELERQYGISIETNNIDLAQLFTGTFKHDDLELALKSVTLPLNLKYQIKNDTTIELERE
ncbi:MAG: FecR domain-containing protein [Bacteroidia bacterium]|nr:FecR domain-containing protein [Bacteroidia bacterium]